MISQAKFVVQVRFIMPSWGSYNAVSLSVHKIRREVVRTILRRDRVGETKLRTLNYLPCVDSSNVQFHQRLNSSEKLRIFPTSCFA